MDEMHEHYLDMSLEEILRRREAGTPAKVATEPPVVTGSAWIMTRRNGQSVCASSRQMKRKLNRVYEWSPVGAERVDS